MPRPQKCRRICCEPKQKVFNAKGNKTSEKVVQLTMEEYETIRLIDYSDMTQEECASQMLVARTTVQRIYNSARKKIADFVLEGGTMVIDGGNYKICENDKCQGEKHCCCCPCRTENGSCNHDNCPYI